MQQAHPAIVTRIQKTTSQLSTPVTLHTKPCQNERRKSLKNVKLQPIYIKSLGFVFFFWTWFTHMHIYISTVMFAPNLQNIMSPSNWQKSTYFHKKHLDRKLGAKYHVSISVFLLSLFLADLTTRISWEVRSYSSAWALSWWRWWRWQWWQWWRCWWWWWWWVRFGEKLSFSIHQSDVLVSRVSFCSSVWTPRKYQKR